jgi:peptidoglycan/xylan/chitin deacetylase (PgdA/CDA1 family)
VKRALRRVFSALAAALPTSLLRRWFTWSTKDLCIALCFHRVSGQKRPTDPQPELTVAPPVLDQLIGFLAGGMPTSPAQLFVCFDDGYADAVPYVATRAPLHPSVQWLFFVCPEKLEKRAGFRWDLFEASGKRDPAALGSFLSESLDPGRENDRPELRQLGDHRAFALATVADFVRIATLSNVALGNHTNCHFRLTELRPEQVEQELRRSTADFERLLGTCRHFAFPFGMPGTDFTDAHTRLVNSIRSVFSWSVEQRPFTRDEIVPGAVLPRLTVYQFGNVKAMVLKICVLATLFRRKRRFTVISSPHPDPLPEGEGGRAPLRN